MLRPHDCSHYDKALTGLSLYAAPPVKASLTGPHAVERGTAVAGVQFLTKTVESAPDPQRNCARKAACGRSPWYGSVTPSRNDDARYRSNTRVLDKQFHSMLV
jgi:hypothetical protein